MRLFFLVVLFGLVGCISTEYDVTTHQNEFYMISVEKEVAMGRGAARSINKEMDLSYDPAIVNRVRRIGNQLAKFSDRKELTYYFDVIAKDEINAFALPGGYIYIFEELVENLKTDDELAFVLAHEIGHIAARHSVKRYQAAIGANLLLLGSTQVRSTGNVSPTMGSLLILNTLLSGYSQDDELIADSLAVKYTKAAGYDPKAGILVMKTLEEKDKDKLRRISYFRTHPFTIQRIRRIKEELGLPLSFTEIIN